MKTAGIVVEYNPLHNGHIYHLAETKKATGCDSIVAVMSGNFVQRGEPGFLNKWARTKMALKAGVDIVLELPVVYATSSAEGFAFGAVSTLDNLGIVDYICFGSESGNVDVLSSIAEILVKEPDEYRELLKFNLKSGLSFPVSRQLALTDYFHKTKASNFFTREIEDILNNSNNILAIEYIKALKSLNSQIQPFTIKRINNNYNDEHVTGSISSATAIRKNFLSDSVKESLPGFVIDIISQEMGLERCPIYLDNFSDIILYKLRDMSLEDIGELMDVSEGLEYRIKRASEDASDINELIKLISNKRYPSSRIQRILIYSLLGITKETKSQIKSPPNYIRVLGFNDKGKALLKEISKKSIIPIITNPSKNDLDLLKHDIHATDTYVLAYKSSKYKYAKQDLKTPPIYEKSY